VLPFNSDFKYLHGFILVSNFRQAFFKDSNIMELKSFNNKKRENFKGIDRLIHEPSRYAIMALLYVTGNSDFLFLMSHAELTGGNLSTHLKKLESSGYILIKKKFSHNKPHTGIKLTEAGRSAFEQYRKTMKQLLDRLPGLSSPAEL
jgi:DNA-binding MarR family transcriptional regulator